MTNEFVGWRIQGQDGKYTEIWAHAGTEAEMVWTQQYGTPTYRAPRMPYQRQEETGP